MCVLVCFNDRILMISQRIYKCFHEYVKFYTFQLFSPLPFSPKAPSAPIFIHFSELTTTSVNVSWGEPKQANGIIEGYRLVYEPCTPIDGEKLSGALKRGTPSVCRDIQYFNPPVLTPAAYAHALTLLIGLVAFMAWLMINYGKRGKTGLKTGKVWLSKQGSSSNWKQNWNASCRQPSANRPEQVCKERI